MNRHFPRQILLALLSVIVLGVYPLMRYGNPDVRTAAVLGILLATANAIAGYLSIEYAFGKSYTTFMKVVIGGMGLRMAVMIGVLLVLVLACGVHAVALAVSLLGMYALYLVLEVVYIQTKVATTTQG